MSRIARKAEFKEYEGRKKRDIHVRLTKDMLMDRKYLSLNNSSKILYMYMKLWAKGENEFDYAKALGSKMMSPSTTIKAIRELVEKGFIERKYFSNGGGHIPNRYKFSDNWTKKDK